jgi:hypothetical protein
MSGYPIIFGGAPVRSQLLNGLLAYWNFNNNGSGGVSLVDSSGNGNTLTQVNTPALITGIVAGGAYTNPTNLAYFSNSAISINGSWSTSFWFNKRSLLQSEAFSAYYSLGSTSGVETTHVSGGIEDANNWIFSGGAAYWQSFVPSLNAWNNVVLVNSTTDGFSLYINSIKFGDTEAIGNRNFTGITIGANHFYFNAAGDNYIDEFGIWNRALSPNEILALYNAGSGLTYPFRI